MTQSYQPQEINADPPGVVAVYISGNRVIAHAASFEPNKPGGFTVLEAQKQRAKQRLAVEVVKALASPTLYEGWATYDYERLMDKMAGAVKLIPIGHADDADDE